MRARSRLTASLAVLLAATVLGADKPAPRISITSPADGTCTKESSIPIVVSYRSRDDDRGRGDKDQERGKDRDDKDRKGDKERGKDRDDDCAEGNIRDIDLLRDGVLLETYRNRPAVKRGAHVFSVDLGALAEGRYGFQARAFQGNRNAGLKGVSNVVHITIDRTHPAILNLTPTNGSTVNDSTPDCAAVFVDTGCGVDSASVVIILDNQNVTAQAQVTASGFAFTPVTALADGEHALAVTIADRAGNPALSYGALQAASLLTQGKLAFPDPNGFQQAAVQAINLAKTLVTTKKGSSSP